MNDASIDLGGVTIRLQRTEGGKVAAFWEAAGEPAAGLGEFAPEAIAEPTSPLAVLPNGERTPEGGRAWIHGDRVAVVGPEDWRALLGRLGIAV